MGIKPKERLRFVVSLSLTTWLATLIVMIFSVHPVTTALAFICHCAVTYVLVAEAFNYPHDEEW